MHLGNARTALLAWLAARSEGGRVVLRMEDLDRARVVSGAEARLIEDFAWLGLDWDEGPDVGGPHAPYRQSERKSLYEAACDRLAARGRAFPCICSRADVARAASAPHEEAGEDGPRYPGTCRDAHPRDLEEKARATGRRPVLRFRGNGERISFHDEVHGDIEPLGEAGVDDFVLRRADGVAAYQLAVVVDDAAMNVSQVVRGQDLLTSTPRQIALYRALGFAPPRFAHVPLGLAPGGERLAKRTRPESVADARAAGVSAAALIGMLAASVGLAEQETAARPADFLPGFDFRRISKESSLLLISNAPPPSAKDV
jgi:glutamyl-tRNA synthetase